MSEPSTAPRQLSGTNDRLQHLLFLVHGIGQHDDFVDDRLCSWDGSEGTSGGNHEFRELMDGLLNSKLREVPLALAVQSVEWHSRVHGSADEKLRACAPDGAPAWLGDRES